MPQVPPVTVTSNNNHIQLAQPRAKTTATTIATTTTMQAGVKQPQENYFPRVNDYVYSP